MSIDIISLGPKFYTLSGSQMGELYDSKGGRRDWAYVRQCVGQGETVTVRPATQEELIIAETKLAKLLEEDNSERMS